MTPQVRDSDSPGALDSSETVEIPASVVPGGKNNEDDDDDDDETQLLSSLAELLDDNLSSDVSDIYRQFPKARHYVQSLSNGEPAKRHHHCTLCDTAGSLEEDPLDHVISAHDPSEVVVMNTVYYACALCHAEIDTRQSSWPPSAFLEAEELAVHLATLHRAAAIKTKMAVLTRHGAKAEMSTILRRDGEHGVDGYLECRDDDLKVAGRKSCLGKNESQTGQTVSQEPEDAYEDLARFITDEARRVEEASPIASTPMEQQAEKKRTYNDLDFSKRAIPVPAHRRRIQQMRANERFQMFHKRTIMNGKRRIPIDWGHPKPVNDAPLKERSYEVKMSALGPRKRYPPRKIVQGDSKSGVSKENISSKPKKAESSPRKRGPVTPKVKDEPPVETLEYSFSPEQVLQYVAVSAPSQDACAVNVGSDDDGDDESERLVIDEGEPEHPMGFSTTPSPTPTPPPPPPAINASKEELQPRKRLQRTINESKRRARLRNSNNQLKEVLNIDNDKLSQKKLLHEAIDEIALLESKSEVLEQKKNILKKRSQALMARLQMLSQ